MHPPKVLVVEDRPIERALFCRQLKAKGFEIFEAESGLDAIDRIQLIYPHLVLSDIDMPKMDGIEMVHVMRSNPKTCDIPVILMTGLWFPSSGLQLIADGLGVGPIHDKLGDFLELVGRIRIHTLELTER